MKPQLSLHILAAALLAAGLSAQGHSLIISPDAEFILRGFPGTSAMALVDDQESIIVTPDSTTPYEARPFRTFSVVNVMHGDGDNDGNLNDTDLYGDLNCLMVRNRPPHAEVGPVEPGMLWMSCSFNTTAAIATTAGIQNVLDGDVFRGRNGRLEWFVHEADLLIALGDSNADIDIDGMCQDQAGSLWFTFWNASNTVGTATILDGDVLHIPASAITYDTDGLITAIQPGSAVVWASEVEMDALVANSNTLRQTGAPCTRAGDVAGLNIDPNGGMWTSPQNPSLTGPNIIFASNFLENFDNIWSTASGGSAAVINGVTMGYLSGSADGTKIGVGQLAQGQDSINAMVVVPEQTSWIAMDSPLAGGASQGTFTIELGKVQPNSAVGILMSFWPNDRPAGWVDAVPIPAGFGFFQGNPWLEVSNPFLAVALNADAAGYLTISLTDPGTVPAGLELLVQGVGIPFGRAIPAFTATGTSSLTF